MSTFQPSQNIGDIVAALPKASEIFRQYRIDFCCGGNRPLSDAINQQLLNEREILQKLEDAYTEQNRHTSGVDFTQMSRSDLIDYIVHTHHVLLRKLLPELSELTGKILRVHGPHHSELFTVHKLFHQLKTELEQHLIKEEEMLFPLIKQYDQQPTTELLASIQTQLADTEAEHETAGGVLKELRRITNEYRVPDDGCGTYLLTWQKLQELEADLFQHIHLENNILFRPLSSEKQ